MLELLGLFNAALMRAVQIVVDVLLTPRQRRLQEQAQIGPAAATSGAWMGQR